MITVKHFSGQTIVVLGLGRSGSVAAKSLQLGGSKVIAWDDNPNSRAQAVADGISVVDPSTCDWNNVEALVLSPGIPHTYPKPHPFVTKARNHHVPLVSDIDLLGYSQSKSKFVGITGTNGKSTTTELIGHILRLSCLSIQVGGNIGRAALSLESLGPEGIYVLELSSFQLEISRQPYDIALLLNIAPDHIQRHGSFAGYVEAKRLIFKNQHPEQVAIIGIDDPHTSEIYNQLLANDHQKVVGISGNSEVEGGVYVKDGKLIDATLGPREVILDLNASPRPTKVRNHQNLAAAYAVTRCLGVSCQNILQGLGSFTGLPHRQECVGVIDNVTYVNDSKATNEAATEQALLSYNDIFWILGGRSKTGNIESLKSNFHRVRKAFLIGEAADLFAEVVAGKLEYELCDTLEHALNQARLAAIVSNLRAPVVLLSPACESFDQFKDFEERGNIFRHLVNQLPGMHAKRDCQYIEQKVHGVR